MEQDPRIQKAFEMLKARSVLCNSEEEAIEKAKASPVHLDPSVKALLEEIVQKNGYRKASFYLPEELIAQLDELAEQGIDFSGWMETSLQAMIQVVRTIVPTSSKEAGGISEA